MTENQKYLKEAQGKVKEFQTGMEAERLNEASINLENVILAKESDSKIRLQLRSDCLFLWLEMLQLIDRHLDPAFNRDDVPDELVQPPPTSGGVIYPPGADPKLIDDPTARAEYEKAIAANREKAKNYRLQIQLHRLNERIPPKAEEFIGNSYTSASSDQEELKTAIDKIIEKPERKAELSKLLAKS